MTTTVDRPQDAAVAAATSPRRAPGGVRRWVGRGGPMTLLFFLPMLLVFGVFSWWPILRSLVLSFQRTNFLTSRWVGWSNFQRVLDDPLLGTAVRNTTLFVVVSVAIGFPLPLLLAVVIAEMRRARAIASVLVYLPVVVPPAAAVLLWKTFYQPGPEGTFNQILGWFGLGPYAWLNDGSMALPAIVVQATWASFGTATIIYLATLMTIRTDLYEAAEVDGAGILQRFWHVTLPQLRTILLVMLLLQIIAVFQLFTEPYIMTDGGPENSTVTILMLIYRYAFVSGDYGRATALSLMLAAVLSVVSAVYLWLTRRWSRS